MIKNKWSSIIGYEGLYEVSNFGEIKSLPKVVPNHITGTMTRKEKLLKTNTIHPSGYFFVTLIKNGKRKSWSVHRLVAEAFIPNYENKPQVNHIDCNKSNNKSDNLEWVTNLENQTHAIKNGRVKYLRGSEHSNSIIDEGIVRSIRELHKTKKYSHRQIGCMFGITKSHAGMIIRNKTWCHVN